MALGIVILILVSFTNANKLPNIVFMLTDDLGWNSMYNNAEDISPALDGMVKTSLKLESFYVYKYCAPSRASFLTGRMPYKVCATRNNLNPPYIPEGINLGYTMIAKKLQNAPTPYYSYQVGKWHQGLFSPEYIPIGRGFNKSYSFLGGGEDHYNQKGYEMNCTGYHGVDLFENIKPAWGKNGTYNGYAFTDAAINYIKHHVSNNPDNPFFLYFALHNTHAPIQAPADITAMYHFNQTSRNTFDAMTTVVDQSVKNVTDVLKSLDLWNNTLFVWTTDNGAPVSLGGSNDPLRGSKGTNFEGGVRVPILISGGILPSQMQGKILKGLFHIADWYSTFCYLAGNINPKDENPNAPSPIDSINMWPYISGKINKSPRNIIVHDHLMYTNITHGTIRNGSYKLIIMTQNQAGWYGQFSPNTSWNPNMEQITACSVQQPCLFDIENDMTEHNDLSKELPDIVKSMTQLFYSYDNQYHPPKTHPPDEGTAFCNAVAANKGFAVPWKNATSNN